MLGRPLMSLVVPSTRATSVCGTEDVWSLMRSSQRSVIQMLTNVRENKGTSAAMSDQRKTRRRTGRMNQGSLRGGITAVGRQMDSMQASNAS